MNQEQNASEALLAFCGWLTLHDEEMVLSAHSDCAPIVEKIKAFCEFNKLSEPRPGWEKNFKHPPGVKPFNTEFVGDAVSDASEEER
jgi:hypothetical protein